jgi:hypothetical protein
MCHNNENTDDAVVLRLLQTIHHAVKLKPERKILLVAVRIILKQILKKECDVLNWIRVPGDKNQWRALVNMPMIIHIS